VIVLDASALVELILDTSIGRRVADRIQDPVEGLHTPHLADLEVVQVLRRYVRDGALELAEADTAIEDYGALDLQRHDHTPLLGRIWDLRNNLTAYDAAYVALSEALDAVLLTCDGPLARAPGMAGRVLLVEAGDSYDEPEPS
jgi:predicted nucleic acid-binding protein